MSLSDFRATAIVPVSDLIRASEFYESKLGLRKAEHQIDADSVLYQCADGSSIQLHTSATGVASGTTLATWEVDDIESEVMWFQDEANIEFLNTAPEGEEEKFILVDERGGRAAWFTDPDGNWLCLHQLP